MTMAEHLSISRMPPHSVKLNKSWKESWQDLPARRELFFGDRSAVHLKGKGFFEKASNTTYAALSSRTNAKTKMIAGKQHGVSLLKLLQQKKNCDEWVQKISDTASVFSKQLISGASQRYQQEQQQRSCQQKTALNSDDSAASGEDDKKAPDHPAPRFVFEKAFSASFTKPAATTNCETDLLQQQKQTISLPPSNNNNGKFLLNLLKQNGDASNNNNSGAASFGTATAVQQMPIIQQQWQTMKNTFGENLVDSDSYYFRQQSLLQSQYHRQGGSSPSSLQHTGGGVFGPWGSYEDVGGKRRKRKIMAMMRRRKRWSDDWGVNKKSSSDEDQNGCFGGNMRNHVVVQESPRIQHSVHASPGLGLAGSSNYSDVSVSSTSSNYYSLSTQSSYRQLLLHHPGKAYAAEETFGVAGKFSNINRSSSFDDARNAKRRSRNSMVPICSPYFTPPSSTDLGRRTMASIPRNNDNLLQRYHTIGDSSKLLQPSSSRTLFASPLYMRSPEPQTVPFPSWS